MKTSKTVNKRVALSSLVFRLIFKEAKESGVVEAVCKRWLVNSWTYNSVWFSLIDCT